MLSVVIATYNRCDTLKVTLEKIAEQTISPGDFEVLVVDDDSPDGTSVMVESLKSSIPYKLRYFHHENQGPGFTQNRGIKEAENELVLLLADDVWATPELLEEHLRTHRENLGENIAVQGKVLQSPELPPTVMHKYWDPFKFNMFEGKRELKPVFFFACNISFKKKFVIENGMFLERKGAANEDIELGYRLGQNGFRILYNQNALGYHYHSEDLERACRRAYERGCNLDLLFESIPKSVVLSLYHILTFESDWRTFVKLIPREVPRGLLFNKWSVDGFWLPILRRVETNRLAALFANRFTYRGTVYYHIRKGFGDQLKRKKVS